MRTRMMLSVMRRRTVMFEMARRRMVSVVVRRRCGVSVMIVERIDYDDDAAACRLYGGIECARFCLRTSCDDTEPQEGAEQCSCKPFFIQHMTQLLLFVFFGGGSEGVFPSVDSIMQEFPFVFL